ncbi:MAG: helix-turn-helix domain-containing protein [Prevotellaceae bacterium]|jgi:excisionase family DNA binding protein|nr:helix-turn-helix domain-containing protein [Prevotellaceae bacterium]
MEKEVLSELKEIKQLTLLTAKKALTMSDAALLTGLSKSHIYKLVCSKKVPYYKSQGGKLTYFDKSESEAWQLMHRVATKEETEQAAATYLATGKMKGGKR